MEKLKSNKPQNLLKNRSRLGAGTIGDVVDGEYPEENFENLC
jgi:hypothetical protein